MFICAPPIVLTKTCSVQPAANGLRMTLLRDLVDASERVGTQSSRRSKIAEIAALLRRLQPDEIDIGVAFLAGETLQEQNRHRLFADRQRAHRRCSLSPEPRIARCRTARSTRLRAPPDGAQSPNARDGCSPNCLRRPPSSEQSFLVRLLIGELRQGALAGLMIEAVASAANLPVAEVRRAAMIAGGSRAVAAPR